MFRNIIFDWSGTLANDLPPVLDATNRLLEFHGRPPLSEQDFRETFRLPFKGFYDEVLPEIPLADLEVLFGTFFAASQAPVVLLPHAREFLEFCQSMGVRMFILSSARQDFVESQAHDLGVPGFFEAIHAGVLDKRQTLPGILEAHGLRPDETAFIGDMEHDIEAARECGVHSVAVLTGYDPPSKLMRAGPEVVVADLSRLRRLLAGGSGKWGISGGKIEHGETAESALRRGIPEETGLEITNVGFETDFPALPDTIHIRGLAVTCHIGAGEEERSQTQELRLDLDLFPSGGLHNLGDDLGRTVDYHAVALAIQSLAATRPRRLVETLAEETLDLLRDHYGISSASVTVRKFILPFTDWVGVTLQRGQ